MSDQATQAHRAIPWGWAWQVFSSAAHLDVGLRCANPTYLKPDLAVWRALRAKHLAGRAHTVQKLGLSAHTQINQQGGLDGFFQGHWELKPPRAGSF